MDSHERAATLICTKCGTSKQSNCFSERQAWCKDCINAYSKVHYQKNRDKVLKRKAKYRSLKPAQIKAAQKAWAARNKARTQKYQAWYREANREYLLAQKREHGLGYYAKNKAKYLAKFIARRELKEKACPLWADLKAIERIYVLARKITEETGIFHEVDHVIPLQGRLVCGLHVESNLRVITRDANRRKFNNHVDDIV